MDTEEQKQGKPYQPEEEREYLSGEGEGGPLYEWARENQLSFSQFRQLADLTERFVADHIVQQYEPQSREEQLRAIGLREVTIDLAAEGKAVADVISILSPLPDYSQGRVFEAVARLVVPQFFEKTNFDFLREVSMEPTDE